MQYLIKASLNKQLLWTGIKLSMFIALLTFIYLKLGQSKNIPEEVWSVTYKVFNENYVVLLLASLLMPVNWGLEALKWKILSSPIVSIPFSKAIVGVLTGLSLGFITPHGLGDYFGRIMQTTIKERTRLIGAVMLGRFSQMIPTLLFGMIGVYYFSGNLKLIGLILCAALSFIAGLYILSKTTSRYIKHRGSIREKLSFYFGVISEYTHRQVLSIMGLSVARYLIFTFQFLVIMNLYLPMLDRDINFAGITWIFLMKSILPAFNFLSDLGVREFSAVYFFDQHQDDLIPVISASLTIWVINILVPSIAGTPFTLKMKLGTK